MKKSNQPQQSQKFIRAAKESDCEENEKAFAEKLKKLAPAKSKTGKK